MYLNVKLQDCLTSIGLDFYVWQCCCRTLNCRGRETKAQTEKRSRAGGTCAWHAEHLSQTSEQWNLVATFRRSVHMKQVCTWASQLSSMRLSLICNVEQQLKFRETTWKRKIYTQTLNSLARFPQLDKVCIRLEQLTTIQGIQSSGLWF